MAIGQVSSLGIVDGKEYYYDTRPKIEDDKGNEIDNPNRNKTVWRIPDIREAIIAEPGFLILSADYSQIEVKLMAHLSRDPVLIAAINSGKDIHSFNATEVFGGIKHFTYADIAAAKKDKSYPRYAELIKLRNDIKTVTFGVPYGAGKNKVALMTGMTPEAAQEFIDAFFSKFSVLGAWLKKTGDNAIRDGFSLSPRGRRRFYELPAATAKEKEKEKIYSQVRRYSGNHPIQAGNVDMLKPAMWQIYNDLRTSEYDARQARILFCVHDEIVMTAIERDAVRRMSDGSILTYAEYEALNENEKKLGIPGPIEAIMMKRMQESYDGIIPDIVNKIDVAIGPAWEKS